MKQRLTILGIILTTALFVGGVAGCGGGGGGGSGGSGGGTGGGDSGAGTATVATLSALPSLDLSTVDMSARSSADLSVLLSEGGLVPNSMDLKGMGEDLGAVGNTSRGGCEANAHKKEIFREGQIVQMERCFIEAMEKGGQITIPDDSYNYYSFTPPEMEEGADGEGGRLDMCDGIPVEDEQKKQACLGEAGGMDGKSMKIRVGRFAGELRVDMCAGAPGSETLRNEGKYSASGSVYTITATRIGDFAGKGEKSRFTATVDLGTDGYVDDGVVNLGTGGTLTATSTVDGGFGSGNIRFEAIGSDSSIKVYGAFGGRFIDPFTDAEVGFTGKVYSRMGGSTATGASKFHFGGLVPPMRVKDMIPFDIAEESKDSFIRAFGNELGIDMNSTNYEDIRLCDNPAFDWENPTPQIKPMILMSGDSCGEVTHRGIDAFAITNIASTGDFGSETRQMFTVIANSGTPYYDEVEADNLKTLDEEITTPAFDRNWDCSGTFTEIDFQALMAGGSAAALESAMAACHAIEEKVFASNGMGDYDCNEKMQMNGVDAFADGGGEDFGRYGGELVFKESEGGKLNTCPPDAVEDRFFVSADDKDRNEYCIPLDGVCSSFTLINNTASPLNPIEMPGGAQIEWITYDLNATPKDVKIDYLVNEVPCVQYYYLEQHTWEAPPEFGLEGSGRAPGEAGFIPAPCIRPDGTFVTEDVCRQICSDPMADCGA